MKNLTCKITAVVVFVVYCFVSRMDYAEQVIYSLDYDVKQAIIEKIHTSDVIQMAEEYTNNKSYYDSLTR